MQLCYMLIRETDLSSSNQSDRHYSHQFLVHFRQRPEQFPPLEVTRNCRYQWLFPLKARETNSLLEADTWLSPSHSRVSLAVKPLLLSRLLAVYD